MSTTEPKLAYQHAFDVIEGVEHGSMDLGGASQAICVLNRMAEVFGVAGDDLGAFDDACDSTGGFDLTGMRAQSVDVGPEGPGRPEQRFDRETTRDVGRPRQPSGAVQSQHPHRQHPFGAIEKREALLRLEPERRQATCCKDLG